MTHPDIIQVEASQKARVEAERADIFVTVTGSSLFSGAVALQKAREVAELVAALKAIGIEEAQIKLENVRAQAQSGTFSKTSSVFYSLRVADVPLARVADAIGTITTAKSTSLGRVEWRFADETPLRDALREKCLQIAIERARSIVKTLGLPLVGVYQLEEEWNGVEEETVKPQNRGSIMARAKALPVSEAELGMAISHAEEVSMHLTIQFRIGEFAN